MGSMSSQHTIIHSVKSFTHKPKKTKFLVFAAVFGVIGVAALIRSFAASPAQSFQAELGTLSGGAAKTADQAASGGNYVKFASSGSSTFDSGRLEAEDQSVVNRIHLDKNCYHWSWVNGALDPADSVASGGAFCGSFGATDEINWDKIGFSVQNVPSAGTYTLRIAYRNGYSSTAENTLLINGASVGPLNFEVTSEDLGGEDYGRPFTIKEIAVNLQAGTNTIQINASTGWTGFADLDYFQVFGTGGGSGDGGGGTADVKCVVYLHGKGGYGGSAVDFGNFISLAPNGNAEGWGGLQWLYWPASNYNQIVSTVTNEVAGSHCTKVILHGFSNGAAAAAYLYCRGETLGGRLVGVIVDDPVMDNGVDACSPGAGVRVKLYTTGGIPFGPANCTTELGDWTCINGVIIGLSAYTSALGVGNSQSSQDEHAPYGNPPELGAWW